MATQHESLDDFLVRRIAEEEGVSPDEITVEYIHEQRKKRYYPTTRYNIGSDYSGYIHTGLRFLTGQEIEEIKKRADRFIKECTK
jgi:hypothetical protein